MTNHIHATVTVRWTLWNRLLLRLLKPNGMIRNMNMTMKRRITNGLLSKWERN